MATFDDARNEIAGKIVSGSAGHLTPPKLASVLEAILNAAEDNSAPLDSPAFTGTPAAPTASTETSTTQLATTAFVHAVVAALVDSSPGALDTLNELAAALGDDANFAATMTSALAAKAPLNITQAGTGAVVRPLQTKVQEQFSVKDWGATGDGVTDDTTAIANAVAYVSGIKGILDFPPGTYVISSTIVLGDGTSTTLSTFNGFALRGVSGGASAAEVGSSQGAVRLVWVGAAGGTMMRLNGPIYGIELYGLTLDCAGIANTAIEFAHPFNSRFHEVTALRYVGNAYYHYAHSNPTSVSVGSSGCVFENVHAKDPATGGNGMLIGVTSGITGNHLDVAKCTYIDCEWFRDGATAGTYALGLQFCDNISFYECHLTSQNGSSGSGLRINPPDSPYNNTPAEIAFYNCPIQGGVSIRGTGTAWTTLYGIAFLPYPVGDGEPLPVPTTAGQFFGITDTGIFFGIQQLDLPIGSSSALPFRFATDTNTGFYSPGADTIGFVTGGTERLTLGAAALYSNDIVLNFADGSAAAPSYSFLSDTNTGIFSAGADAIGMSAGGTSRLTMTTSDLSPTTNDGMALGNPTLTFADLFLASGAVLNFNNGNATITHAAGRLTVDGAAMVFNEAGADLDFRVEGVSDANLFFIDASTARVGIHTNAPGYDLDIVKSASGGSVNFRIRNDATGGGDATQFVMETGSGSAFLFNVYGNQALLNNYSNGPMVFLTNNTTRMTINATGEIGIGGISAGSMLDVVGTVQADALRIDQAATAIGTGVKTISNAADSSTNFGKYFSVNLNGTTVYIPCSTVAPT